MRILVDLTHPAHVHFFRHAIDSWRARDHEVLITTRRKDLAIDLVERFGFEHQSLGEARSGLSGLTLELFSRTRKLSRVIKRWRPDVLTAIGGVFIAQAGLFHRVPSVVFYDTENATLSNLLTYPFSSVVATPRCYGGWVPRRKHRTYAGYHELAYTHPARFTPDPGRLAAFGLEAQERFIVLRLVSWGAAHDVRDHGLTSAVEAVERLEPYGRVLISSEAELPPELESRRLNGPIEDIHHLLAFACLVIGESATMVSESATLGTPAILVSTSRRGYTDEQEERYRLVANFDHPVAGQRQALERAVEILEDPEAAERWAAKRKRMLSEMIDVSDYVVQLVEEYG